MRRRLFAIGASFQLFRYLQKLLVENDDIRKKLEDVPATLQVGRGAFFDVAQIGDIFQLFRGPLQLFGEFHDHQLHQGRAADRLLHAEFAALHAPGEVHFSFSRQQRNGSHLAQIDRDRVIRVDGLFHLLLRMEKILVRRLRIEKLGFFVEIETERFRVVC